MSIPTGHHVMHRPQPTQPEGVKVPEEQLQRFVGLWRNEKTRTPGRFTLEGGVLRFNGRAITPMADGSFLLGSTKIEFKTNTDGQPMSGESVDLDGTVTRYLSEKEWTPTASELATLVGDWHSEEAQATFTFSVEGDRAFIVQRPTTKLPLRPLYRDHFSTQGYVVWVTRDASGKVDKLHVGGSRMRDMPFVKVRTN